MSSQLYPSSPTQNTNKSPTPGELQISSPSSFSGSGSDRSNTTMAARRTRSSRACDQCRRNKNKCEPCSAPVAACRSCVSMGIACTYTNPTRKRGPPKGYILALERRLQQVEALLGTIIGSQDPRARSLVEDLTHDPLAYHIMRRVERGPFSPTHQPLGTTKQDFLESMIMSDQDPYETPGGEIFVDASTDPASYATSSTADDTFAIPDFDWHQRIQDILDTSQASRSIRRESFQSTTSAASSHSTSASTTPHSIPSNLSNPPIAHNSSYSRSNTSPTSHTHHSYTGPLTPVDALSPLTPASMTMASSSRSSPLHTPPGTSPYPYSYMNLPASVAQSQQAQQSPQYSVPFGTQGQAQQQRNPQGSGTSQHQSQSQWFHDFNGGVRLNQFGNETTGEGHDTKPSLSLQGLGLGLGTGTGTANRTAQGNAMPMVRVYDSIGYDVSNNRMHDGRYPP